MDVAIILISKTYLKSNVGILLTTYYVVKEYLLSHMTCTIQYTTVRAGTHLTQTRIIKEEHRAAQYKINFTLRKQLAQQLINRAKPLDSPIDN